VKGKRTSDSQSTPDVRQLLRSLTHTLRGLEIANADPALLMAYQKLLAFLASDEAGLYDAIFGKRSISKRENSTSDLAMSDDDIAKLNIEDLEKILLVENISKADLAQIATMRFSVTKGSLSKLSREALRLKLKNLIENEKTHQTIGRLARSSG